MSSPFHTAFSCLNSFNFVAELSRNPNAIMRLARRSMPGHNELVAALRRPNPCSSRTSPLTTHRIVASAIWKVSRSAILPSRSRPARRVLASATMSPSPPPSPRLRSSSHNARAVPLSTRARPRTSRQRPTVRSTRTPSPAAPRPAPRMRRTGAQCGRVGRSNGDEVR